MAILRVGIYSDIMGDEITTTDAAKLIGCAVSRVRALLLVKRIAGRKMGRDWLVDRTSAIAYRDSDRRGGRPRKQK